MRQKRTWLGNAQSLYFLHVHSLWRIFTRTLGPMFTQVLNGAQLSHLQRPCTLELGVDFTCGFCYDRAVVPSHWVTDTLCVGRKGRKNKLNKFINRVEHLRVSINKHTHTKKKKNMATQFSWKLCYYCFLMQHSNSYSRKLKILLFSPIQHSSTTKYKIVTYLTMKTNTVTFTFTFFRQITL